MNLSHVATAAWEGDALTIRYALPESITAPDGTATALLGHYTETLTGSEAKELWEQIEDATTVA